MKYKIILSLALLILASSIVSAFGVSAPYWQGNDMKAYPGMSAEVMLNLQNMVGDEGLKASMQIIEGEEIVSLSESEYILKAGEMKDVALSIMIPGDAIVGTIYKVKVSTTVSAPEVSGGLGMATATNTEFNIVVQEKPASSRAESGNLWILGILIIITIAILVVWAAMKKKSKK
jgi:hypothetical protein